MDKDSQIIALRNNAVVDLQQLKTIEEAKEYHGMTKSWTEYARAKKIDAELMVLIKEQTLRTERILGQMIKRGRENGELVKKGETQNHANQYGAHGDVNPSSKKKTLTDLDITKDQSRAFQKLAEIPDDKFEAFINEKKENVDKAVNELSTAGAVRLAEEIAGDRIQYQQKVAAKVAIDDRIHELLKEINKWPKLYRAKIKQGIKG